MTTTKSIDSYRLTDLEEPTDEMLAQIMREAAEDARKANADATKRFFDEIERQPQQSVNCKSWREESLKNHQSLIFESVFSSDEKVDFVCRAKQQGYFIRLFFVATSHPSINAARIAKRVIQGGHDVPISKIISRYQKSIFNCKKIIPSVDRLYVYDNSVEDQDASLLFRMSDGELVKSYTDNIPQWAMTILK